MKTLNEHQYNLIKPYLPVQRGNVKIANLTLINAVLYVAENGCKWRALPREFGNWHTVYTRLKRWAEHGVLECLFVALQKEKLIKISVTCIGLDSTSIKVHPDAGGCFKKNGPQSIGKSRGGLTTKIHMVAANDRLGLTFFLSPGQADNGQNGRHLLHNWRHNLPKIPLVMDRAYEGVETRECVENCGFEPVVPPKSNRLNPWIYDKVIYKRRNEIERLFRRLKSFRRVFSRFEKLDRMFATFVHIALIMEMIK